MESHSNNQGNQQQREKVLCRKCIHYYVTWDASLPHGCRLFQMKTHQIPSQVVKQSSGKDCEGYSVKKEKKL